MDDGPSDDGGGGEEVRAERACPVKGDGRREIKERLRGIDTNSQYPHTWRLCFSLGNSFKRHEQTSHTTRFALRQHPLFMTGLSDGWQGNAGLQAIAAIIDEGEGTQRHGEEGDMDIGAESDNEVEGSGNDTDGAVSGRHSPSESDSSDDEDGRYCVGRNGSKLKASKSPGSGKKKRVARRKRRGVKPAAAKQGSEKIGMAQVSMALL